MIDVKIDKGVSTMTFAGSGLEIAAEICMMVHGLYTQLYHRAGPAVAKGCKETLRVMLAREDSLVWDYEAVAGMSENGKMNVVYTTLSDQIIFEQADIGKTVFLTREGAEKALEAMREEEAT